MHKHILALLVLAGVLVGCNTIQGAGKDIEHGGQKIEGAAERHK